MIEFIKNALNEDIGQGDYTTLACVDSESISTAQLLVKENGVLAGLGCAKEIFHFYDASLRFESYKNEGDKVKKGDVAFTISGSTRSILTTERLVLNVMQRMSGVATTTLKYAEAISHTKAKVLDTRKTTPGMRSFEKQAVKFGGGTNHRFSLDDMILIKDNHIDAAGGIDNAIRNSLDYKKTNGLEIEIEVEVRSIAELKLALSFEGVSRIMFDNFTPEETAVAVKLVNGRCSSESSGGITLDTIVSYAEAGVDFIYVGALTHSVKALDLSLKIVE
jgi:nicotinate-nucleotide pyrophosphorylase (carboxylating)